MKHKWIGQKTNFLVDSSSTVREWYRCKICHQDRFGIEIPVEGIDWITGYYTPWNKEINCPEQCVCGTFQHGSYEDMLSNGVIMKICPFSK